MNPKEVIENAEDTFAFFSEEEILFHMTQGMDAENIHPFVANYTKAINDLRKLLECYTNLLDPTELE